MKHLLGEATPAEQEQVKQWLKESPEHLVYYHELKEVWDRSRELAVKSTVDENKAWEKFRQRIGQKETPVRQMGGNWRKIAAAIVLLIGLSVAAYLMFNQPAETVILMAREQVIADTLPDKSVITVNKNSSVSYPSAFKGNKRVVALKGEAFFHVTPDKKKPFIVTVNDVTITVVGTSFNVKETNGDVEVIVETGIVRVERNGKVQELRASERLEVSKQTEWEKDKVEDKLYNYYRTREFACNNTPLWKLVEVVNEAYDVNIVVPNEDIRNLPMNVPFYNVSLEQVLEVIAMTNHLTIRREGDKIILE